MQKMSFAERIRRRRIELGMKQFELAERAGISYSAIAHWETGRNYCPRIENIRALAGALEVTIDWLMGGNKG